MLMLPAAIVALLFYLIVGPLTISQRFQTGFKSLGQGIHQTFSSVLSLPHSTFEPQVLPVAFDATTVEVLTIAPVETFATHSVEIASPFPVPPEGYAEVVVPEVPLLQHDDKPSPTPTQVFVVPSGFPSSFCWCDLFSYRFLVIFTSFWFPFVAIALVTKLLSPTESHRDTKPRINEPLPKLLPPKILTPPRAVQVLIENRNSDTPLEPVFSSASPEPPTFWLATKQNRQDQPSSPSPPLRLLDISFFENETPDKLSPLSSPPDSGCETTLPDTAQDVFPLVSHESVTNYPERLSVVDAQSIPSHDSKSIVATSEDGAREDVDTTGFDTELEDDDDGSITVTNSTANLADLIARPTHISAEVLAAKLESVTAPLIEKVTTSPEPLPEDSPITAATSDDSRENLSLNEPTVESPSVNALPPAEPGSDITDVVADPASADEKAAVDIDTETVTEEDETPADDNSHSQGDSECFEPWTPNYPVPIISITPPSEVDPEDFAPEFDSEDEREECEYDDDELEFLGDCPDNSGAEVTVVLDSPSKAVETRDDPCRSPITTSGMLWSDDEGDDLGPPPTFGKASHVEVSDSPETGALETSDPAEPGEPPQVQNPPVEEEIPDDDPTVNVNPNVEESANKTITEPAQDPQPAPEAPAQVAIESTHAAPVPSPSPSPGLQNSTRVSRSFPTRGRPSFDNEDRGEGSSRSGRTTEPQRLQYFHCCSLYRSDGLPASWEKWEMGGSCTPTRTHLRLQQFVRPTDRDGESPTTRIAIDNLDADWFRMAKGVLSYSYLTDAMKFFSTKSFQCWRARTIDGVEYPSIGYATVDFDSLDEAIRMFGALQGRRLRGPMWHWRLEFVDPNDETHGGRKVTRTKLVPDSVKQALAAEMEASTSRGRDLVSEGAGAETVATMRPPVRVRPQLSIAGRSLFAGAVANVVQDRRTEEQPAQPSTRAPNRRSFRS